MTGKKDILSDYLHVQDDGKSEVIPAGASFWEELAGGAYPQLDQGRLMLAFSFSESWSSWERHPAGEELVMLLSGTVVVVLEENGKEQLIELDTPGSFVLVPQGVWHTARTQVPTTMIFLTPGCGTEHRDATG